MNELIKVTKFTIFLAHINSPFVTSTKGPERPPLRAWSSAPRFHFSRRFQPLSSQYFRKVDHVLIFPACFLWTKLLFPRELYSSHHGLLWCEGAANLCPLDYVSLFSQLYPIILALLLRGLSRNSQSKSHQKHDQVKWKFRKTGVMKGVQNKSKSSNLICKN